MINLYSKTKAYDLISCACLKENDHNCMKEEGHGDHVRCIRQLVRWKLLFPKDSEDLVNLVAFCRSRQFRGSTVLREVLLRVFKKLERFEDKDIYYQKLFFVVLASKESIDHFYFTCNATRFKSGEMRFTDLALSWLVSHTSQLRSSSDENAFFRTWDYRRLHEILKHGCSALIRVGSFTDSNISDDNQNAACKHFLIDLLCLALEALYVSLTFRRPLLESVGERVVIWKCIVLIFRSIPCVSVNLLYRRAWIHKRLHEVDEVLMYTLWWLQFTNGVPNLFERLGKDVVSLKHLCRCTIRKVLYRNWKLPAGLNNLGLPLEIILYLNLVSD